MKPSRKKFPSAAAIAAGVEKSPELVAAEERLAVVLADQRRASRRLTEVRASIDVQSPLRRVTGAVLEARHAERVSLSKELERLHGQMVGAQRDVDRLRASRGEAVLQAISPLRRHTAERVVAAIGEIQAALAVVAETVAEVEAAGAHATRLLTPPYLDALVAGALAMAAEARRQAP